MELSNLTTQQKIALIDAHLTDKPNKDAALIKLKLFDKNGIITRLGESTARKIAQQKHKRNWV